MSSPSFNAVNYSLRPSKTIQRGVVFEGLRQLQEDLDWSRATYLGFGSIWFTDFVLAHRVLRITRMVSVECHPIGFRRAQFNKPYSFVRVKEGLSLDVIPELYREARFPTHPIIAWLDYDAELDLNKVDELRFMVENAQPDSVLLVTFDVSEKRYGSSIDERRDELRNLFGRAMPVNLGKAALRGAGLARTLAKMTEGLLKSTSVRMRKENGCELAFRIAYRDKATMLTIGAVFPSAQNRAATRKRIRSAKWAGVIDGIIEAPHLTFKEASALQAALPLHGGMNRTRVQNLGFDLEYNQIEAFSEYYRYYPTFAQVVG
jgi:hypothetical protein